MSTIPKDVTLIKLENTKDFFSMAKEEQYMKIQHPLIRTQKNSDHLDMTVKMKVLN